MSTNHDELITLELRWKWMDGSKCCIALRLPFVMVFPSQQPGWDGSDRLVWAIWQANDLWRNRPWYPQILFQAGSAFTRYPLSHQISFLILHGSNGQGLCHTFETFWNTSNDQGGRLVRALWSNKRIESSCDLVLKIWCWKNRPQWTQWGSQAIMISVEVVILEVCCWKVWAFAFGWLLRWKRRLRL